MKTKLFVAIALCISTLLFSFGAWAAGDGNGDSSDLQETDVQTESATDTEMGTEPETEIEKPGWDEIPYGEFQTAFKPYGYKSFDIMNREEAEAAGVPEGYSGYVVRFEGTASGVGMGLDLTKYRVNDIESITFRIWCPAGTKSNGVRLTNTSTDSWIMLADPGSTEEWVEVVLSENSNFNAAPKDFSAFDDGTGYCKRVNFVIRRDGTGNTVAYIDSITVKLRDPDSVPPVIEYDGETLIDTTAGKVFSIDITAYDEYDKAYIAPEYIFSEGAVDENGLLLEGEHTCTVRFTDYAGNSSSIEFYLDVEPRDVTAPKLSYVPDKIYANSGMRFLLEITATDDRDGDCDVAMVWSEGAFDRRERFVEGEHTLTVSATDTTGNKIEKIIPVSVTGGLPMVE